MNKPWWDLVEWPHIDYNAIDGGHCSNALRQVALRFDETALERDWYQRQVPNGLEALVQGLVDLGGRVAIRDHLGTSGRINRVILTWDRGFANVSGSESDGYAVNCSFLDREPFDAVSTYVNANVTSEKKTGQVYALVSTRQGYELRGIGVAAVNLERDNYTPEFLAAYDHIIKDLGSDAPCGRISLFDGPPGTGKSFGIRALMSMEGVTFVVLPPAIVAELAGPALIQTLLSHREENEGQAMVLLLEDGDDVVATRGGDNMSHISTLLNLTDGIMGGLLNIKVIATTNAVREDLDPAILRPGRLCRRVHLGALGPEQSERVLARLLGFTDVEAMIYDPNFVKVLDRGYQYGESYTLAELYRFVREDAEAGVKPKPKGMGFST